MKIVKRVVVVLLLIVVGIGIYNYHKLNILAGYSAKNTASSVFVANRTLAFTDTTDNNFSPIDQASDAISLDEQSATASVFGLLTRKAFYRKGLGAVLALDNSDITATYPIPNRTFLEVDKPYPYGKLPQKDTLFKNVNYANLHNTVATMCSPSNQTRAVLVLYKNHILAEQYADRFTKESKILGWSMTKSITSTLFGILAHQQKINLHAKAPIASWQDDARKNITIHNLLQMNSGLEWDENYDKISDVTKMLFLERDMTKTQAYKPLASTPNTSWNYSSGTSNLLSGILRDQFSTHQEYLNFWYAALIDKIGMNSMVVEADLAGNYVASSYAWATPRDWAKLGQLYLNNGWWNGEQLFTKEWVRYATTPTPTSNNTYGAQLWLNKGKTFPDVSEDMYFFDGYQGQYVFIFPKKELVVVRMGLSNSPDFNAFLSEVVAAIK